ncbi:ferrous iron transport protein B [Nafulsella turpanensis]|uniref:ferrous iron transport protein B n=1 Tax=Nafulsella turpanensis TaxID=1265690 RepID=UPI0003468C8B|nr:ferrous iron transport protein B [Nafulsella turpanensis]
MSVKSNPKIALIGNPNAGKSSLFNQLTGLSQKVGNFPGVTVEKRSGHCRLDEFMTAKIIDLPGAYSIYARCNDEKVAVDILGHPRHEYFPDILVFIADASNLNRSLLLFTQVKDLGVPVVLALNMLDLAEQAGIEVDIAKLRDALQVQVVPINARTGEGLDDLKTLLANPVKKLCSPLYDTEPLAKKSIAEVKEKFDIQNSYQAYQLLQQGEASTVLSTEEKEWLQQLKNKSRFRSADLQAKETLGRHRLIHQLVRSVTTQKQTGFRLLFGKIDRWLTHPSWGYLFFVALLFVLFQLVFAIGHYPMLRLDAVFAWLTSAVHDLLPNGFINSLLTRGILPALAGVFVFIPHLLVFYTFVALLEESGYMSRVIMLMDKLMRFFGLTGRSAVPLLSNAACGVPAILASRECSSWREKLSGIFITPLVNCSNRLPVYIILIALFVPYENYLGIINLQGLVLLGMYFFSFIAAVLSSWILKLLVKTREEDYLMMELPYFTSPYWKDIWKIVKDSLYGFSLQAVRTVIPVSVIFWALLNFSPTMQEEVALVHKSDFSFAPALEDSLFSPDASYARQLGSFIEPVVSPLGFDWQIGLAILSSFAAREAFIGSMATIYSQETNFPTHSIIERIESNVNPHTEEGSYALATVFSLLVFYAFAMQFFNMLGRLMRNGSSWWAPLLQLVFMTGLAYISAYIVFQVFS